MTAIMNPTELSSPQNTPNRPEYDDEIDLFELFQNLWDQKWLITAITAIATILGVVAALAMTPIYKAESRLMAPLAQDVQALKVSILEITNEGQVRKDLINISANQVYSQLQTNLNSIAIRRQFFAEFLQDQLELNPEKTDFENFDEKFNKNLSVTTPGARDANQGVTTVTLEGAEPIKLAEWTNDLIAYVIEVTKQDLLEQAGLIIANETNNINDEINSRRSSAEARREDRTAILREALIIAQAMDLEKPMIENAANQLNMEYMRGTRSIEAEIAVLENRVSDDPFIEGMRNMQERIAFLNGLKIDPSSIRVARIDQAAEVPTSPIKPNKKLIVAVALVLGGMLGVFIALIRSAVRKRRQTLQQTA